MTIETSDSDLPTLTADRPPDFPDQRPGLPPPTPEELFRGSLVVCVIALIMALGVALSAPASASLAGLILFAGVAAVAGAGLYALTRPREQAIAGVMVEEHIDTDLAALLDAMTDPVAAVGPEGDVRFANAAYVRFLNRFDMAGVGGPIEGPRLAFAGHPLFAPVIFRLMSRADVRRETLLVAPAPGQPPHRIIIEEKTVPQSSSAVRLWLFRDEGPLPVEPPKPVPEERFDWAEVLGLARLVVTPDGRITSTYGGLAELIGAPVAPASSVRDVLPELDLERLLALPTQGNWGESQRIALRTVNETTVPVTVTAYHKLGAQKTIHLLVVPEARPELAEAEPEPEITPSVLPGRVDVPGSPMALFPRLFAEAPLGAALLGADRKLVASNAAFTRLLGREHTAGMTLRQLVGPDYGEAAQRLVDLAQQGLAPAGGVEVMLPGDTPRSARLYATRVGKAGSALLFVVDSTEQRLLEEQVSQSEKMKAVGQLAGGIAHDFNNLLTAITGYCDLLLQSHPVGDPSFADLSQIRQTAARAANLVRQLLAFSRQQTMRPTVVWLNDMLAELKVFLGRVITERITLQVTLGRDLWPVHADPGQIERVIMNLAVNARDAMPNGGRLILKTYNLPKDQAARLTNVDLRPGDYVVVEVTDTGVGIPKENLSKIFEPFFTTKGVGEGTGLGLSTAYGIITQSGGQIAVESQIDHGTTFRLYLPRDERAEIRHPEPGHQDLATRMQDLTGKGTILLVEDEDAVRSFACRALRARGYEVLEAASGEDALELMRQRGRPVDLMVSDVVMPGLDGPTLARTLREEFGPQKVILISGYAEDAIRKNLETEQNVDFLPKPFSLKELAQKVKDVLAADNAAIS